MGATVYSNIHVYSIDLDEAIEDDLLGSTQALVVLAETYEKNCYPHTPAWGFFYMGSETDFQRLMLPFMRDTFDDGINQGPIANNGKAFEKYMRDKAINPKPINVSDLHKAGCLGFSFDELSFSNLRDKEGYKVCNTSKLERYIHPLSDHDDIKKMVKASIDARGVLGKWWYGLPYKIAA